MAAAALAIAPAPLSAFGALKQVWHARTGAAIAATPAVGGQKVYVGSWDGFEYAFRENTGRRAWRTYLGQTTDVNCPGGTATQGITSGVRITGSTLFVGGGDVNWYALSAATGKVLWRLNALSTVPASQRTGYYNWATPALFDGSAYMGLSSQCDAPLTQGKLLRVSLSSHQVRAAWSAVSDYDSGGGIWTSPVVDRKTHTVFVTTGTRANSSQLYAQAIVALDTTSLQLKTYWPLPPTDLTRDADWGTSPLLFHDGRGRSLVGAANKNGILYAFRRNHLNAGPVWQTRLGAGGPCPQCGEGTTSNGYFDGTRLFFAAGATTIRGHAFPGSVRAIDPATGRFLWQLGLPSEVLGSLAGAHGMIAVPAASGALYIIRASTGKVLYANQLTGHGAEFQPIYAAPKIVDGYVFIGTTDGVFHAFKLPATS